MPPPEALHQKPPRGFTVGAGLELVGLSIAIFGLAAGSWFATASGLTYIPNVLICAMGAVVTIVGFVMHAARV